MGCLARTHILSFHNTHLVVAEHTFCLATTHILSCHNTHLVLPEQRLCSCRTEQKSKNIQGHFPTLMRRIFDPRPHCCMVFRCASNGICPGRSKIQPKNSKIHDITYITYIAKCCLIKSFNSMPM